MDIDPWIGPDDDLVHVNQLGEVKETDEAGGDHEVDDSAAVQEVLRKPKTQQAQSRKYHLEHKLFFGVKYKYEIEKRGHDAQKYARHSGQRTVH